MYISSFFLQSSRVARFSIKRERRLLLVIRAIIQTPQSRKKKIYSGSVRFPYSPLGARLFIPILPLRENTKQGS